MLLCVLVALVISNDENQADPPIWTLNLRRRRISARWVLLSRRPECKCLYSVQVCCQPVCASVKPAGQCAMQAWEALSCPSDSWSNIRDDQQLWYNLFSSFYKFTFQAEYPDLLLILHIPAFLHTHPLHQPFLKQLGMNQIWNFCDGRLKYKRLCVLVASALLCLSCVSVVSLRVHQHHHPLHVSLCHPPVGTHAIVWHRTEPDPPLYYYFFCTNPPFLFILLLCMCFNSALCQSCRRKCFPEKIFTLHCKIVLVCTYHLLVVLIWSTN